MTFEQAESQATRDKEYLPFRIVWIKEVDNGEITKCMQKQQNMG